MARLQVPEATHILWWMCNFGTWKECTIEAIRMNGNVNVSMTIIIFIQLPVMRNDSNNERRCNIFWIDTSVNTIQAEIVLHNLKTPDSLAEWGPSECFDAQFSLIPRLSWLKRSNKQGEKVNLTRGQRSNVHLSVPTFILKSQVKVSTSAIDNGSPGDKTQLNKLLFPFYVSTLISINSIHNLCLIETNTRTHTLAHTIGMKVDRRIAIVNLHLQEAASRTTIN